MVTSENHIVPSQAKKGRLSDYAIGIFAGLPSRKSVKKAIKRESLLVDGMPANTGLWVQSGMILTYKPSEINKKIYELKLNVIYEDDHLAIVNKPAGLLTSGNTFRTLTNALPYNLQSCPGGYLHPRPVHRLDFATSGLVIIAKNPEIRKNLGDMLEQNEIDKTYHAIVHGDTPQRGSLCYPIENKNANTVLRRLDISRSGRYTLLQLHPVTGRTHQLRIHCAHAGFPIVGDKVYGLPYCPGKGLFLCASRLQLHHPVSGDLLDIQLTLPKKFERLMAR